MPLKLRACAALVALACIGTTPPDPPPPISASEIEGAWTSFTLGPANQIRIPVQIGGERVVALLDTGVSVTVITPALAERLRLRASANGQVEALGGSVGVGWASGPRIVLAGTPRSIGRVAIAALDPLAAPGDAPVEMLAGADLLAGVAIDIDYPARRLRLLPSGRLPFVGTRLPLNRMAGSAALWSEVTLGRTRIRRMLVDTGDGGALTLTAAHWAATRPAVPLTTSISWGLTGPVVNGLAVTGNARLGPLRTGEIEVRVERDDGFSARVGANGRIGGGLLSRWRVLLDPGAGLMLVSATGTMPPAPVRSTSGLLVLPRDGALDVVHVMRGSPAEANGWTAGARICTVDGRPAAERDTGWTAGAPGTKVTLGLCDGEPRELVLARFY